MLTDTARDEALRSILDRAEKAIEEVDAAMWRGMADASPAQVCRLTEEWQRMEAAAALAVVFPPDLFLADRRLRGQDSRGLYRVRDTGGVVEVATDRTTGAALWHTLEALIPQSEHDCPGCGRPLPPQIVSDDGWSCPRCRRSGVPGDLATEAQA